MNRGCVVTANQQLGGTALRGFYKYQVLLSIPDVPVVFQVNSHILWLHYGVRIVENHATLSLYQHLFLLSSCHPRMEPEVFYWSYGTHIARDLALPYLCVNTTLLETLRSEHSLHRTRNSRRVLTQGQTQPFVHVRIWPVRYIYTYISWVYLWVCLHLSVQYCYLVSVRVWFALLIPIINVPLF